MAEFDPAQLDQLEDVLELLDDPESLESLELSPALGERLGEYQDVLAICREAFPVEAPTDGLLADVIAEAHEVSRRHRHDPEASPWQRFWERWRGTLIPGFALAGSAAAVLWIIGPEQGIGQLETAERLEAPRQDERAATPSPSEPASEFLRERQEPTLDDTPEAEQPAADAPPTALREDEAIAGQAESGEAVEQQEQARRQKKSQITVEPVPDEAQLDEPEPLSKDDTWFELERANAARARGECDAARGHYDKVVSAASDNSALARAFAGIGLCYEQQQRYSDADTWFGKARATSPSIDAWINAQRDEQPLPGDSKKKKSKQAPAKSKKQSKQALESL